MKNLCIYHKNCADGFGAAIAAKALWKLEGIPEADQEFMPAHYGDTPPDATGKNVLIVDFSYDRETLLTMHSQAKKLVVIDHHKTAEEALRGLPFCHFDMNQSGAMLTWKYCFFEAKAMFDAEDSTKTPLLIQYIQDRDLWRRALPDSKAVSAALQALPMTFENWMPYLNNDEIDSLKMQGRVILRYQQQTIDAVVNGKLPMIVFCGHVVPCINTTTLISEIGNELSKDNPFAMMYFDTAVKRIYSLRSQEGGVDVSEIAKRFGGGGHACAAGFSIMHDQILMSASNPFGHKLEELLTQMADEMEAKTEAISKKPPTILTERITDNNNRIIHCLKASTAIQSDSMAALDEAGPNQGPTGTARI